MQTSLFESANVVNINEAPEGFYAVLKDKATTPNVCNCCDARDLCQANIDDWCLKNRCMPYEVVSFKDGKTYFRIDRQSVFFKKIKIGGE